jgi:hypothetical protein
MVVVVGAVNIHLTINALLMGNYLAFGFGVMTFIWSICMMVQSYKEDSFIEDGEKKDV